MVNSQTGFFNSFRSFIATAGRSVVFTSLFYTLWLVIFLVSSQSLELHSFKNRMIGGATLEGYDIDQRIALFYKAIALLCFAFALFNALGYFIFRKAPNLFFSEELKIINYTSVAGIFLFLFQVFEVRISETIEIIYFIHKFMLAGILLKLAFKKNTISVYYYALLLCIASALYCFVSDCVILSGSARYPDFYIIAFILACVLLIALHFFLNSNISLHKQQTLRKLAFILAPLLLLPLVSILKDEIILILKANAILVQNRLPVFSGLLMLIALLVFIRYKKSKKIIPPTERALVTTLYFPLFIFSMVSFTFYSFYVAYYDELFEMGNVYLPMMEFKLFGILPPLEKLNTHLLSDYFFGAIYALFSGLKNSEIMLYDFLLVSVSFLLHYYLLYFITRNPFIALFFVFLFPFADTLLPFGFCLSVLGIMALNKILFHNQSFKHYTRFFCILLLLILWRIDLAYACCVTLPLLLLFYHLSGKQYRINWPALFKGALVVSAGVFLLLAGLCLYRHINLFSKAAYLLNYMVSSQSYGLVTIGFSTTTPYKMHYFIFPVLTGVLLIFLAVNFKRFNRTKRQGLAYLSLVFISVFYLVNFNRGLTRHGLIENSDFFVSYLYLALAGAPFILLKKQSQLARFCAGNAIAFFVIIGWHIPDPKNSKSIFEYLQAKLKTPGNHDPLLVSNRVVNIPADARQEWTPFAAFVNKHIPPGETFIDFDNKPMLYFYTGRITPSWFYQNPLCIHNDFLQQKFIDDLKDYKTPYLLFSSDPKNYYSAPDGVPNFLRHYRMAEYFYRNFKPYVTLGKFGLWKRNSEKDINICDTLFHFEKNKDAVRDQITISDLVTAPGKKYLVKIVTDTLCEFDLKLYSHHGSIAAPVTRLSDTLAYVPVEPAAGKFSLSLPDKKGAVSHVYVLQYDYLPDFYAEKFATFNFSKLPYVWASYDKAVNTEPVLYEKNMGDNHAAGHSISFSETLDKTTGNTVLVTFKNTGTTAKTVILSFGNSSEKGRAAITFDVLPSGKPQQYAIRISCLYKWYSGRVNTLSIWSDDPGHISFSRLKITKGS